MQDGNYSGFLFYSVADLMANLIEKYAAVLDVENLPEPPTCLDKYKNENANKSKHFADAIEMDTTA